MTQDEASATKPTNGAHSPGRLEVELLQSTHGADLAIVAPDAGIVVAVVQHDPDIQTVEEPDGDTVIRHPDEEGNAARIAACWNACAGMTDPEAEVSMLRSTLKWIVEFCDEHPEWTEKELCNGRTDSAEALWLAGARETLGVAQPERAVITIDHDPNGVGYLVMVDVTELYDYTEECGSVSDVLPIAEDWIADHQQEGFTVQVQFGGGIGQHAEDSQLDYLQTLCFQ